MKIGDKFNKLTVVNFSDRKYYANTICDCGQKSSVRFDQLKSGGVKSCGCLTKEVARRRATKHGLSRTKTYSIWRSMLQRCNNKNDKQYKNYGARGISVCEDWSDFANFVLDMGKKPKDLTLDRINNDGPYSKENCRWVTMKDQCSNTRRNRFVVLFGDRITLTQAAERLGVKAPAFYQAAKFKNRTLQEAVNFYANKAIA